MQMDQPQHNKRRRSEPTLWADEPASGAPSGLGNALPEDQPARGGDEHHDDVHSLREENARLRQLVAQLSDRIR
jgi:hypothetical protein